MSPFYHRKHLPAGLFRWADSIYRSRQRSTPGGRECAAQGKTAFLGAYALGKAQRCCSMLDPEIGPILTHTATENTNGVLRDQGHPARHDPRGCVI